MKKNEIQVGQTYRANVSGKLTTVRVDAIRTVEGYRPSNPAYGQKKSPDRTAFDCTNLTTGRQVSFKSAMKFRSVTEQKRDIQQAVDASAPHTVESEAEVHRLNTLLHPAPFVEEGEHCSDPMNQTSDQTKKTTTKVFSSVPSSADSLVSRLRANVVRPTDGGLTPTAEQEAILAAVQRDDHVIVVEAGAGCLAADTVINVNRAGRGYQETIENIAKQFTGVQSTFTRVMNGKVVTQRSRPWDMTIPTRVARAVGGVILLGTMKRAWCSGEKQTYTLATESGRSIRATLKHPFLLADGTWKTLAVIKVGDILQINGGRGTLGSSTSTKLQYARISTTFHPFQTYKDDDRHYVSVHRLVIESVWNDLPFHDYLYYLRHDQKKCETFKYLQPSQIVHHKNENPADNRVSNLEVLESTKDHSDQHSWGNNILWQVGHEKVVSVEPFGLEMTYDIEMETEPHNFLANGFVVHNTGKTSTLKMIGQCLPGNGQYTAFNSSLVAESKTKFAGSTVTCNTTHSLAFRAEGVRFSHRLGGNRVRGDQLAQMLGITAMEVPFGTVSKRLAAGFLASQVMGAIRRFCQSADPEVTADHFKYVDGIDMPTDDGRRGYSSNGMVRDYLLPFARKAWKDLSDPDGQLPFSHDHYVKVWQLNKPVISADYILVDESQDSAPVFLDVLKQQKCKIIFVGDSAQQIYEWRGAVNAMAHFPNAPRCFLSQSFRFGPAIAEVANAVLATLEEPTKLRLKGSDRINSTVEKIENPTAVLTRTNAVAVASLLGAIADGKKPFLIGGGGDTVAFVEAAQKLQTGEPTSHPDLCCFGSWGEVQEYVKQDEGDDLKLMVKIIDSFGATTILAALRSMPAKEEDADLVISTAHKSKGREWDRVKLAADFPTKSKCCDSDRKLLYVALTRAKLQLDVTSCPFFTGEDSLDIKSIRDRYHSSSAVQSIQGVVPEAPSAPPAPTQFTWSNKDGKWYVRGMKGQVGKEVNVVRKDGSSQKKKLVVVIQDFESATLYRV